MNLSVCNSGKGGNGSMSIFDHTDNILYLFLESHSIAFTLIFQLVHSESHLVDPINKTILTPLNCFASTSIDQFDTYLHLAIDFSSESVLQLV